MKFSVDVKKMYLEKFFLPMLKMDVGGELF